VLAGVAELAEEIDVERATRSKETSRTPQRAARVGEPGWRRGRADEGAEIDLELLDVTTSLDRANLRSRSPAPSSLSELRQRARTTGPR